MHEVAAFLLRPFFMKKNWVKILKQVLNDNPVL